MAVVMTMKWPGVSPAQYDALRTTVHWEGDPPAGALYHVASFEGDTIHVVDVWDSAEQFNAFVGARLMPAVQAMGITSQPDVAIRPAHAVWAPGYTPQA
jgi:hypothetical protein